MKILLKSLFSAIIILSNIYSINAESVKFKVKKEKVNDLKTERTSMEMKIKIEMNVGGIKYTIDKISTTNEKKQAKIIDITDDKVKKFEVYYEKAVDIDNENGTKNEVIKPYSGKTYMIDRSSDNSLSVKYPDGNIPSEDELNFINKEYNDFDGTDDFSKHLNNIEIKIGERIPLLESVFKSYFLGKENGDNFGEIKDLSIILKGTNTYNNSNCAVFDIKFKIGGLVEQVLNMEMILTGNFLVSIDGIRPIYMKLEGPIKMNAKYDQQGQEVELNGNGSFLMETDSVY